ncbi:hypothetical protein [Lysobacter gummosus]|uniref:hypothetical protein n=1 Tax=Lysobacter gummosus TaxID=262324 RepID=UPI00362FC22B
MLTTAWVYRGLRRPSRRPPPRCAPSSLAAFIATVAGAVSHMMSSLNQGMFS